MENYLPKIMSENNMEKEGQIDLMALFGAIWNNRKKVIRWTIAGFVVGVIATVSMPKQYTSTIKIAPESQTKQLGGSAGALASMMGVDASNNYDGINEKIYPEILKSTPFLLEFAPIEVQHKDQTIPLSDYILKHQKSAWWNYITGFPSQAIGWVMSIAKDQPSGDMPTIENSPEIQYDFVGALGAGMQTTIEDKLGIITINSTFQDPRIAKTISDSLVVKLQRYMSDYRTAKTRHSLDATTELFEEAKTRYYAADEQYARAIDRNQNLIAKSAEVALTRLANERNMAYQIYGQLAQQVESLRIKLQEEVPVASIIEPATTPIRPSAPRTMFVVVAWAFLGAFASAITIVIKTLLKKQPDAF